LEILTSKIRLTDFPSFLTNKKGTEKKGVERNRQGYSRWEIETIKVHYSENPVARNESFSWWTEGCELH
jgi:hypothetical protein